MFYDCVCFILLMCNDVRRTSDDVSREISQKLSHPQLRKNLPSPATPSQSRLVATPRIKKQTGVLVPFEGHESLRLQMNKGSSKKQQLSKTPSTNIQLPPRKHLRRKTEAAAADKTGLKLLELTMSDLQVSTLQEMWCATVYAALNSRRAAWPHPITLDFITRDRCF